MLAQYFEEIIAGQKTFELRLADWQCQPGDSLILLEIDEKQSSQRAGN